MKNKVTDVTSRLYKSMARNSPKLLALAGIAGFATAIVWGIRATPKAMTLVEEKKKEVKKETLTPAEYVAATWRCYMPVTALGILSATAIIMGQKVSARRNAALATAYSLSEAALKEYQDKVTETIGERKEQKIRDSIAEDKIKANPVNNSEVIITGKGESLCYDAISGRYFKGDIEKIRRAENKLNKELLQEMYISLNDYYYEIGLPGIDSIGDDIGWNVNDGLIEFEYSSQLTEDGTPCLVIGSRLEPRYDFAKLM